LKYIVLLIERRIYKKEYISKLNKKG
jgi:hypothetical protein